MQSGFGGGGGRGRGGHGMGRGRGRHHRMMDSDVNCICPQCNTVAPHQRGVPCFQTMCPNCGAAMTRQFSAIESAPQGQVIKPVVNADLCNGCQRCIAICPFGAIEIVENKAVVHPESCNNCRVCVRACPVSAIQ